MPFQLAAFGEGFGTKMALKGLFTCGKIGKKLEEICISSANSSQIIGIQISGRTIMVFPYRPIPIITD